MQFIHASARVGRGESKIKNRHAVVTTMAFLAAAAFAPAFAADFQLTSSDIGPDMPLAQDFVFNGFDCTGGNQSPALRRSGADRERLSRCGIERLVCPPPTGEPHGYMMIVYALKVAASSIQRARQTIDLSA